MRIQKTICDRCGREIQDKHSYTIAPRIMDTESRDILPAQPYAAEMDRDYCEDCLAEVMEFLHRKSSGGLV